MPKSKDAFRTISEVAEWLDTQPHVLRFWESKFTQVRPVKRAGGRRYYRPADMLLLGGIKSLLHDDGMTIKGVQKLLREKGIKDISALSRALDDDLDSSIEIDAVPVEAPEAPIEVAEVSEISVAEVIEHPAAQSPVEEEPTPVEEPVVAVAKTEEPVETAATERRVPKKPQIKDAEAWETRRRLLARLTEIDHIPSDQLANVAQSLAQLAALHAKSKEAHAS